jgi:hypothetical protein
VVCVESYITKFIAMSVLSARLHQIEPENNIYLLVVILGEGDVGESMWWCAFFCLRVNARGILS